VEPLVRRHAQFLGRDRHNALGDLDEREEHFKKLL
jgi:hypothetical protein